MPVSSRGSRGVMRAGDLLRTYRGGVIPRDGAAFDPLIEPDLLGLFYAETGVDSAGTLTFPNQKAGGVACTATTAGRPVLNPTGIEGTRYGVAMGSIGTGGELTCTGASLAGKTAATIYMVGRDQTSTLSRLWTYGAGNQNALSFYNNGAIGRHDGQKADELGTDTLVSTAFQRGMAAVTRVTAFRLDINAPDNQEILPVYQDGVVLAGSYSGPPDTTGVFGAGPWVIGANFTGASPFKGSLNAWAMIGRAHSDAEVALWTRYLRQRIGTADPTIVVWTGDSLTVGGAVGGWRKPVYDAWIARNETDRWYRAQGPSAGVTFDADLHYGVSGRTIAQLRADIANVFGPTRPYKPGLIPVMIGTNDISGGGTPGTMSTPYGLLLDEIAALEPGALIVAQACLPRTDVYAAATLTWNAALPAIVAAAQARGVRVIFDDAAASTVGITYTDGIHPDAAGYLLVGASLVPAVRSWAGKAP